MSMSVCPACDQYLKLDSTVRDGQILSCSRCRTTLEVVDINPIELDVYIADRKKQTKRKRTAKPSWYLEESDDYSADSQRQRSRKRKRPEYRY